MKAYVASAIHAFSLIIMGIVGYMVTGSQTAFIPLIFGAILLPLNKGIRFDNKVVAHVAVVVTLLVTIALIKPLTSAIADEDMGGMARVGFMILTGVIALIAFIRSFIVARRNRAPKAK